MESANDNRLGLSFARVREAAQHAVDEALAYRDATQLLVAATSSDDAAALAAGARLALAKAQQALDAIIATEALIRAEDAIVILD